MAKVDEKSQRNKKTIKYIKLYVIPIGAIAGFVAVTIFLTIPKVGDMISQLNIISANNDTIAANNDTIGTLQTLSNNFNQISQELETVKSIAPTGKTEVVKFRDRITTLMQENNLNILSQRLSESNFDLTSDQKFGGNLILQEVPFLFTVQGKYDDIVNFMKSLNSVDDFVIVKEMQLSGNDVTNLTDDWTFKINLVKYQFNTPKEAELNKIYLAVSPIAQISKVIEDYIAQKTNNSTPQTTIISPVTNP